MNFTKVQNRFINSKSVGFTLLRGKKNTGKTLASIYRTMNLENNYCLYPEDKILFVVNDSEKRAEVLDIYKRENKGEMFYSLFSIQEDRVKINSIKDLASMYSKAYLQNRSIKLITKDKGFEMLDSDYFQEMLIEYSVKSKLINKMSLEEIYDEILWIKACNFTMEEYQGASRNKRKRIIKKNSFSREFLYSLMEIYSAELMDNGYKDIYDDIIFAKKYADKSPEKYSHIIIDDVEEMTRGEIEFLKALSSKKDYSSIIFIVNNELSMRENIWLVKGRKLKELGADFKGKSYSLKTVFEKQRENKEDFMDTYQYLDLKHKNIVEFKVDSGSNKEEVYLDDDITFEKKELLKVPVFNEIAAGIPIEINDNVNETFYLPKPWINKNDENFILKVKGDSMIGKNINDGDLVVIRRQNTAYQNDIVAVSLNGEATLKTLSYNDGKPKLMPANPKYQPISLVGKESQILGVAIGIIKNKM